MTAKYNMTLKTSYGILLVPGLLALVQLHFSASSGTSASEFSILLNSNIPCPMRPCYTLSQVMDNPSNYFTSNTTAVFPPGYHEVSTEGQLVIKDINNISLVGDSKDSTMIKCVGEFGLAFINITNLTVLKLQFSMCGAPLLNPSQTPTNISKIFYARISLFSFIFSIYLVEIMNLTATNLGISHSRGMGLLGVNIFGVSSIQQAVFVNNTANCAIVFLNSYSSMETPVLYITNSSFMFGTVSGVEYMYSDFAAGLSIIAVQNTYFVKGFIRAVTTYGNTGILYGNMLIRINCKVGIEVTHVNCTRGHYYGLVFELNGDSTNCNLWEATYHFYMSHSNFDGNSVGTSLIFESAIYSTSMKLENINMENHGPALQVLMNHSSVLIMENVNIRNSASTALKLWQCNVTFYGNTTFLQNKGRYGGAIYAEDAQINFHGSVVFQENEAEYGGALLLAQNVSVVIGQSAKVSFVKNHAYESGGAFYARDSQINIRTGQKLSFVENKCQKGGAMTCLIVLP